MQEMKDRRMIRNSSRIVLSVAIAMTLSVLGVPQISEPEPAQVGDWNIYTVDSAGDVGFASSIALGPNGVPHISYYDWKNMTLKYAHWTGEGWNVETVDSSHTPGYSAGRTSSIAVDSNGYPHISYEYHFYVSGYIWSNLRYAYWNGSAWNIQTVDPGQWLGFWSSIALDRNGHPHISYKDSQFPGGLKYAKWNGTAWSIEDVELSREYAVGGFPSLALDRNDNPHISYVDGNDDGGIRYARWNRSAWIFDTVDAGPGGWFWHPTSLALDKNDNPHIGYYNNEIGDIKYVKWNGSSWNIASVDLIGASSVPVSLSLDKNDNPHVSYVDSFIDEVLIVEVKYAEWSGTDWSIETVDYGSRSSLALDSNDDPHISYLNWTNKDLKYATKAELASAERSITLDIDPDTLNLKSKGKWITAYLTTENAHADDIDTSSLLLNDVIRPEWWDIQNNTTLMVKFDRVAVRAIVPVSDSVDIKVTGQWTNGESFEVHDMIKVINPGQ